MIVRLSNGREIRGEMNGNGGPCTTVARASDIVRFRRRSGQAVLVFPRAKAREPWPDNSEKVDPDAIVGLEAEFLFEMQPGRRRQPRALVTWTPTDEPDDDPPRADWSRALPTGGWA